MEVWFDTNKQITIVNQTNTEKGKNMSIYHIYCQ